MILPIIGEILSAFGVMICLYMERWPMEVVSLTDSLFPGLAGGWFTMLMGVFSYVADVTTEDERTLRIGIVNVSILDLQYMYRSDHHVYNPSFALLLVCLRVWH